MSARKAAAAIGSDQGSDSEGIRERKHIENCLIVIFPEPNLYMIGTKPHVRVKSDMTVRSLSKEDEFLAELGDALAANNIEILRDTTVPYALIEACFPMESGRLDWSSIANKHVSEVRILSARYGVEANRACKLYLSEQIAMNGLIGKAFWINDNIDIGLMGDVRSFEQIFESLLWPPGHIYLLGDKGNWCLNVTFEDDLYFGRSPRTAV